MDYISKVILGVIKYILYICNVVFGFDCNYTRFKVYFVYK